MVYKWLQDICLQCIRILKSQKLWIENEYVVYGAFLNPVI